MAAPTPDTTPAPARNRIQLPSRGDLRRDVPASIVVFLVALPLSLGIAVASGAPVMAGLIAAAVGGIVAGSLGGSPLQVSGPAAGLTVIVAGLIEQFGWQATCAITVAAGVLQILLGISRVGRAALAISPVVVHAMLAGIGITIVLQQLHVVLGSEPGSNAFDNIASIPASLSAVNPQALGLGLVVIAVLLFWKKLPRSFRQLPGQLAAVVLATLLSLAWGNSVERIALDGSLLEAVSAPVLPQGTWGAIGIGVLTMALIASVESLLSAVAVDKMQSGPRTNFNRELFGQGAANVTSGMLGGLPVTGVIVRSATNVEAGARTRSSAILHGVWILLFSVFLAPVLMMIPQSVLAGLLVIIGVQLVKWAHIKTALRTGDFLVYAVTVALVVFANLLEGVLVGLALAVLLVLVRVVRSSIRAVRLEDGAGSSFWKVEIEGSCSFLTLPRLNRTLYSIPAGAHVTVVIEADFVDLSVFESVGAWRAQHEATGGTVTVEDHGTFPLEGAADGAPKRWISRSSLSSGLAPWKRWQTFAAPDDAAGSPGPAGPHTLPVLRGVQNYHLRNAALVRHDTEPLAQGQDPSTLFLTCVDSRIVPNVITSSGPGDLFTVRNVGNAVARSGRDLSFEAALEFAVEKLHVSTITVCGHSNCGAMQALLATDSDVEHDGGGQPVGKWLGGLRESREALAAGHPVGRDAAAAGYCEADQLALVNVAVQLDRLAAHPRLRRRIEDGSLSLVGLFYDLSTANVLHLSSTGFLRLDPVP
ncbi:SulP family inorganic anion transporter [Arthrobacter ginkgonis]|uniref:SulP family inorganic anion transporter n=1 Tax=Arthrobacter ginkgonis TaxID=1630594 RepID=A0ABP7CTB7_9MICC